MYVTKGKFPFLFTVPDTASYIRGWIQMVLAPNDLFSWNNKYNKYNNNTFTDTFTCFSLSYAHQLTLCMLASRSHAGVVILGLLSSPHVFSLPLSELNWRPLFPPRGSGPSFPNMAAPFTGSAHTPLPGSGTFTLYCYQKKTVFYVFYSIRKPNQDAGHVWHTPYWIGLRDT